MNRCNRLLHLTGILFCWTLVSVSGSESSPGLIDTLLDLYDSATSSELTGNFRVEANILRLDNPNGKLADGSSCDPLGKCDPIVNAFIDYETPTADFGAPASVDYLFYTPLFVIREENSPLIDRVIKRDICGQTFKKINVRVHIKDHDRIGSNDLIGNFRCYVNLKDGPIGQNMELSEWSPARPCQNIAAQMDVRLFWRYRIFRLEDEDCGALTTPFSATPASAG